MKITYSTQETVNLITGAIAAKLGISKNRIKFEILRKRNDGAVIEAEIAEENFQAGSVEAYIPRSCDTHVVTENKIEPTHSDEGLSSNDEDEDLGIQPDTIFK